MKTNTEQYLRLYERVKTGKNCGKMFYENFWNMVKNKDEGKCWDFPKKYSNGYGDFKLSTMSFLAHRVSYFLCYGTVPEEIMHKCDNRDCINPLHLQECTHSENMQDMLKKNRQNPPCETRNYRCKMSNGDVLFLRDISNTVKDRKFLSNFFGISTTQVGRIINKTRREKFHEIPV